MWRSLRVAVLLIFFANLNIKGFDLRETAYDCSGYFSNGLDGVLITNSLRRLSVSYCKFNDSIQLDEIFLENSTCNVKLKFFPNLAILKSNYICGLLVDRVLTQLLKMTWGTPWNCPPDTVNFGLTKYFSSQVDTPTRNATASRYEFKTPCIVDSLAHTGLMSFECFMNEYGGYSWQTIDDQSCYVDGLDEFSFAKLDQVNIRLKNPYKCTVTFLLLITMLRGPAVSNRYGSDDFIDGFQRSKIFMIEWLKNCRHLDLAHEDFIRPGIISTFHFMIYNLSRLTENMFPSSDDVYGVLSTMSTIIDDDISQCQEPGTIIEHYNLFVVKRVRFNVYENESNIHLLPSVDIPCEVNAPSYHENITVVCFEMRRYHAFVRMRNRKPLSNVCIVKSSCVNIIPTKESDVLTTVKITFNLPDIILLTQAICLNINQPDLNIISNQIGCVMIPLPESHSVECFCRGYGAFVVVQNTKFTVNENTRNILLALENFHFRFFQSIGMIIGLIAALLLANIVLNPILLPIYVNDRGRWRPLFVWNTICMLLFRTLKNGMEYFSITRAEKATNCLTFGPILLIVRHLDASLLLVMGILLVMTTRTHYLQRLAAKILLFTITAHLLAILCIVKLTDTHNYYNMGCFPDNWMFTFVLPQCIIIGTALIFSGLFFQAKPYIYWDEYLGFVVNCLMSLLAVGISANDYFSSDITMNKIRRILFSSVNVIELITLSIYHVGVKPTVFKFWQRIDAIHKAKRAKALEEKKNKLEHLFVASSRKDTYERLIESQNVQKPTLDSETNAKVEESHLEAFKKIFGKSKSIKTV